MNREILFRGKRLDNGEWLEGSLVSYVGGAKSILQSKYAVAVIQNILCATQCIDVDPDTVGQYTGLRDNHGERIFEGDIVEGCDFTPEDGGYGVVGYDDGAFEITGNNIEGTFHENYWGIDLEVIGNIHDNPELMRGDDVDEA